MSDYEVRIVPKKDCDGLTYWTAFYPAIKAVVGGGDTPEEAIKEAQENLDVYLEYLKEEKRQLPQEYIENKFSGNIALRVPKSTHQKLSELSEDEGMSVNSLINCAIDRFLGTKDYESKLLENFSHLQEITEDTNKLTKYNALYSEIICKNIWGVNKLTLKD